MVSSCPILHILQTTTSAAHSNPLISQCQKLQICWLQATRARSCGWHRENMTRLFFMEPDPQPLPHAIVWSLLLRLKIQKHFGLMHTKSNGKNSETTTRKRKKIANHNFHNPPRFVKFNWFWSFAVKHVSSIASNGCFKYLMCFNVVAAAL